MIQTLNRFLFYFESFIKRLIIVIVAIPIFPLILIAFLFGFFSIQSKQDTDE
jgi:hypothetical protein